MQQNAEDSFLFCYDGIRYIGHFWFHSLKQEVIYVKLGEALNLRKDLASRAAGLQSRIQSNMTKEEGTESAFDVNQMMTELEQVQEERFDLIRRINYTNSHTIARGEESIADLIVKRDYHKVMVASLTAIAQYARPSRTRHLETIINTVSVIPAKELTANADAHSKAFREIDVLLQGSNWTVDLI